MAVLGVSAGLVVFGQVADVNHRFGTAAILTFLPALASLGLFLLLPETRGPGSSRTSGPSRSY